MGKKIFVSYKYADTQVEKLDRTPWLESTTPRHYLDEFEDKLEDEDDIYKGESDGEDLSDLSEDTIAEKLKDRIYDSSVTVVFVSKGFKNSFKTEKNQWIPCEISYSLKKITRGGITSATNAVLAVILPDENGLYDYYITHNNQCGSRNLNTPFLFPIMKKNMFNILEPNTSECNGNTLYHGYSSYIHSVEWEDFISSYKKYIGRAVSIADDKGNYDIKKELEG